MWLSFSFGKQKFRIVSLYFPCEGGDEAELDKFYEDLEDIVNRVGINEKVILLGDLNSRIGNNNFNFEEVMGNYGEEIQRNRNGTRLFNFCQSSGLIITNSLFKHKKIHQFTWEDVTQNRKSIIDYVIVDKDLGKDVIDTRVYRSFEIGSDHYLVGSKIKIAGVKITEQKKKSQ